MTDNQLSTTVIKPALSTQDFSKVYNHYEEFIHSNLKKGVDYDVVQGTTGKPTLLQPGAEKMCALANLKPHFEVYEKEIDHNFENVHKGRKVLGLYSYTIRCTLRNAEGHSLGEYLGSASTLESKYAYSPRNLQNTVLKMAEKRALVGATKTALMLSDRFTQDVEDMDLTGGKQAPLGTIDSVLKTEWSTGEKVQLGRWFKEAGLEDSAKMKYVADKMLKANLPAERDVAINAAKEVLEGHV